VAIAAGVLAGPTPHFSVYSSFASHLLCGIDVMLSPLELAARCHTWPLRTASDVDALPNGLNKVCAFWSRQEGWRGFYRGFSANALKVAPSNGIRFVVISVDVHMF